MRITKQVRVGIEAYDFTKEYSHKYGIPISKVMDLVVGYFSEEYREEKERLDAQFKVILPDHRDSKTGQKTPITPRPVKLSTKLKEIQKDLKSGKFFTSSKYSADNVRNLDL